MRILLVRPPNSPHTIGLKHLMICEPLEMEYVAAGLPGHDVQIMDLLLERGFDARLREFRPDIVGTSSYINGVNEAKSICRVTKLWNPDCLTVVGGVHASQVPEDFADGAVDCVVLGDGTATMPEVAEAFATGRPLDDVAGLALPEPDGTLRRTAERRYMGTADDLPLPRRDLLRHFARRYYYLSYRPLAMVKTTWGCWYRCNFCYTWRITDGATFSRSPESIADELATIESPHVYIVDDIFLANPTRLARLAEILRRRRIRKRYVVYGRSDFIAQNAEIVGEWARLGLSAVIVGLEAATDPELLSMDKENTVENNRRAIDVLRRHGVDTYGSMITQPDYAPDDWRRLRRFIEDSGLYYLNLSPLMPLPGTVIWKDYADKVVVSREAHGLWDLSHSVLPTRMPLKEYYRSLLATYARASLDPRKARRFALNSPPVWSPSYLRLWAGAWRVFFQLLFAHRHHLPAHLERASRVAPALREGSRNTRVVRASPRPAAPLPLAGDPRSRVSTAAGPRP